MKISSRRMFAAAAALAAAGVAVYATAQSTVPSGPNPVAFPADWHKGVMYGTVDRYDTKQFREFYASEAVVRAAREGKPIPEGAVLTLAAYMAKVDAAGNPVLDANGRFIKDKLVAVNVMQKNAAWGQAIPADLRNGGWVYQSFTPDGKVNDKANLTACYQCHLPFAKDDYLTNLAKLSNKFPVVASVQKPTGATEVLISSFKFGPETLTVAAGQAIKWINGDDSPHQVTITGAQSRRSDVMLKGQSATMAVEVPGTYGYICGLHPGMKGTIEVTAR